MKKINKKFYTELIIIIITICSTNTLAREVNLGLASDAGPKAHSKEMERLGDVGDHVTIYHTLGKTKLQYPRYPDDMNVIISLKFPKRDSSLLAAIARGEFNDQLWALGRDIKKHGRPVTIRPLYEGNGNWYPWHAYHKSNKVEDFVPAFQKIVNVIRDQARDLTRFDLNYNRRSANGLKTSDFKKLYPGDKYVDVITVSSYNRCGTASHATKPKSFAEEFRPAYKEIIGFTKRPVGIAETSTTSLCGVDQVEWFRELFTSVHEEFTRIDNITMFLNKVPVGKASNDVPINWGISSADETRFREMVKEFRKKLARTVLPSEKPKEVALEKKNESPPKTRQVSLGLASDAGPKAHSKEVERLGDAGDHVTIYHTLGKTNLQHPRYPEHMNIIIGLKFPKRYSSMLAAIAKGNFDDQLTKFAKEIKKIGRPVTIRPIYEGNGNWYPWHAYHKSNKAEDFVPAFRKIVNVIRDQAGNLTSFDLNYNRRSANGLKTSDFKKLYPGDKYVDVITVSSYNRCGTASHATKPKSFAEEFRPAYKEIIAFTKRPLGIAETSTTSLCGVDQVEWFRELFTSVHKEFTRVDNITMFLNKVPAGKASNDVPIDWGISSADEARFREAIIEFRRKLGVPQKKLEMLTNKTSERNKKNSETDQLHVNIFNHPKLSFPWSLYAEVKYPLQEEFSPSLNRETGESFGSAGLTGRFKYNIGVEWLTENTLKIKPYLTAAGVFSVNQNRWWDNNLSAGLGLRFCKDAERSQATQWGGYCLSTELEHIEYITDVPSEQYDNALFSLGGQGYEDRISIKWSISIGGKL